MTKKIFSLLLLILLSQASTQNIKATNSPAISLISGAFLMATGALATAGSTKKETFYIKQIEEKIFKTNQR